MRARHEDARRPIWPRLGIVDEIRAGSPGWPAHRNFDSDRAQPGRGPASPLAICCRFRPACSKDLRYQKYRRMASLSSRAVWLRDDRRPGGNGRGGLPLAEQHKAKRHPGAEESWPVLPVLDHGFVALIDYMGSDEDIERAARVSYGFGTRKRSQTRGCCATCAATGTRLPVRWWS